MIDHVVRAAVGSTVGALLLFPPLALAVVHLLRFTVPKALRPAVSACAGLTGAVSGMLLAGFGPASRVATCMAVLAAYGAFCFLVAAVSLVRNRWLRIALRIIGSVPIGLGLIFGFVSLQFPPFILYEMIGPSEATQTLAPGLVCETRSWGFAGSSSGYSVHLYEVWPLDLRREVAQFSVMETEPADPAMSCADAYQRYGAASGQ